jgi:minor extracellular serine protease Vpr
MPRLRESSGPGRGQTSATLRVLRRARLVLVLSAALGFATSASAAFEAPRQAFGEISGGSLRAGTITIPPGQTTGRVRVIATLPLPPLAAAHGRSLAVHATPSRLDVGSTSSRAYLARIARAQSAAVSALRREIPDADVGRRFGLLLDGMTVELPAQRLPQLARMPFVKKIYPNLRYTLALNRSPNVIAATGFNASTGARGAGMKIAIVDDGVDHRNPFLSPAGLQYPAGFPRGGGKWTTPKVIVARSFPGPGAGRRGRLAVDARISFHGTHVAGIAAGRAGTTAPSGRDHPPVANLSGVAPDAWIGNYRVFTVPTPIGHVANTPEIVAAFESAVRDGMHVINFSGGGPQVDPVNDALIESIANVAAAGVVPVISAGNDRDEFGMGTAGAPGTAPDAISVAAVSNTQVFAPFLTLVSPGAPSSLLQVPVLPTSRPIPRGWASPGATIVDVGSIVGTSGTPVDRRLCGIGANLNAGRSPLPRRSLSGAIALVSRGGCTFVSKARRARAAGAVGIILVDNRPGEANPIPVSLGIPGGMIADLDGARLREALATRAGRAPVRIRTASTRTETGRSGVVTSFSSAGPTAFEHSLKPDVSAPGGQILSSTLPQAGGPFAVFDGTSMAAPHVAGAAALLRQRHPAWLPYQVKSALVSTAAAAWADTARTSEASVLLQGGGIANIAAADNPSVFTAPSSLSFGDLKTSTGATRRALLLRIEDAGGGSGTWQVEVRAQSAGSGATLELPANVTVQPGGAVEIAVAAQAAAGAPTSDNYGFVLLRRGTVTRRVPYAFFVSNPAIAVHEPRRLRTLQVGNTRIGASRVSVYRYPTAPFGPHPTYTGPPVQEDGAERVYVTHIDEPVINFGVSVVSSTRNSLVDPWLLGSLDENDVEGYAGTPANVNSFTTNYRFNVGAAGAVFPRPKRFFISVDATRNPFTNRLLAGRYVLRSWVDDVFPPRVEVLTTRVAAGRPTIVARILDASPRPRSSSGIDPTSIVLNFRGVLVGVSAYNPSTGLALFVPPREAPRIPRGRTRVTVTGADFQEAKNVSSPGGSVLPNTTFARLRIVGVRGAAVSWLLPQARSCAGPRARLTVAASPGRRIRLVRFFDGRRLIARSRRGSAGIHSVTWNARRVRRGLHLLRAVAVTRGGASASAGRIVRICRGKPS